MTDAVALLLQPPVAVGLSILIALGTLALCLLQKPPPRYLADEQRHRRLWNAARTDAEYRGAWIPPGDEF